MYHIYKKKFVSLWMSQDVYHGRFICEYLMSLKYKSLTISELLLSSSSSSSSSHSSSSSPSSSSSSSRRPQSLSSWRGDQAIASLNLKVILTRISIVHHHKVISKSINHAHSKCLCHEPYNWIIFFIVIIILSQSFQLSWKSWIIRSISIKRNIEAQLKH